MGGRGPITRGPQQTQGHLYTLVDRKLSEVCHRYPKLFISEDMLQLRASWVGTDACNIPLDVPIEITHEGTVPVQEKPTANDEDTTPRTFVRVMIVSGSPKEEVDFSAKKFSTHLLKSVKFVVGKEANGGLVGIGGAHDPAQDGEDTTSDETLIKTACRTTKAMCGLDLSACTKWHKVVEMEYRRANGRTERTVFLMPNVWEAATKINLSRQVEGEETVFRALELTLASLLGEYEISDKSEQMAEVSLFAEVFVECLSYKNGKKVLQFLRAKRAAYDVKQQEERKRAAERNAADQEEREAKRRKIAEQEDERKKKAEEEKDMSEEDIKARREAEAAAAEEQKKKDEEQAAEKKRLEEEKQKEEADLKSRTVKTCTYEYNSDVIEAFMWFDRPLPGQNASVGVLQKAKLEYMLHSLGELSCNEVVFLLKSVDMMGSNLDYVKAATTTHETITIKEKEEVKAEETKAEEVKAE
eukprot:TRINITY_DN105734_c0_g1_i1.p1 TRINITY_DN105734_c0_g1~~TRINITY_DN105734_c0_g1_i1.p1  ORF type:complete len:531 (-),score=100.33 TRINITY_DN105734_c0_g1_i1:74-1486(-)